MTSPKVKTEIQPTFEQAFARLEEIVQLLEGGELTLDESLRLFEEGIQLSRICQGRLDEAEGRIEKLIETQDGRLQLMPMETGSGN
jgi:exodeoxyribonuclease VII small subunit